jgi:hypothetical protein
MYHSEPRWFMSLQHMNPADAVQVCVFVLAFCFLFLFSLAKHAIDFAFLLQQPFVDRRIAI